jgi:hypothetical protein
MGDLSGHPNMSLIVSQYIGETAGGQFGGMQVLDANYGHNKPIELNETAYYPIWYEGDRIGASRVEAWEFIIGGGAGFNHLNGLFSTINPSAVNSGNEPVLQALQNLMNFIDRFDLIRMHPDPAFIEGDLPDGAFIRGINEPGKQYAVYLHHSKNTNLKYIVQPGDYHDRLSLKIPPGNYRAEWVDPASGRTLHQEQFVHTEGSRIFTTPNYAIDIALSMLSTGK